MRPRLIAILALIVTLPLALTAWLGLRAASNERAMIELRIRAIVAERLQEVDADIQEALAAQGRALLRLQGLSHRAPEDLRALGASLPGVSQLFVIDPAGTPVFPPPAGPLSGAERAFLERTRDIWIDRLIPPHPAELAAPAPQSSRASGLYAKAVPSANGAPVSMDYGWHAWFWGNGLQLIFWWRDGDGHVAGAELNRGRLVSDIIDALPDSGRHGAGLAEGRTVLRDAQGQVLYQWGSYSPPLGESARASLDLRPPLSAWSLEHYAPPHVLFPEAGQSAWFGVMAGMAALILAVVGLAAYFYRENARDMREAAQRVSFVNQVSHELKTPLTNIRMYAEMLEEDFEAVDEDQARRLRVIVSESQRLSRLIGNVLTFSRHRRSALRLRPGLGTVDEAVGVAIEQFATSLRNKGLAVDFTPEAPGEARFDRDVVEQVVGNLLSNVEKYAAGGTRVCIATQRVGDTVHLRVADDGPGIAPRERRRVFDPFYRVSNRLTDGVAGTGIGLAIARDLARLHGGDVVLEDTAQGASFLFTFHAPCAAPSEVP